MSFADERAAIESRFLNHWTTTPVSIDGAAFTEPQRTAYVTLFIQNNTSEQISLESSPLHRFWGIITIVIRTPTDQGSAEARTLADKACAIFRGAQFSLGTSGCVTCRTPTLQRVGVVEAWYQLNVTVPYRRDTKFL